VPVAETLDAMDAARQAGKIRTIGVSNFGVQLMRDCLATDVHIVNNQIEYNLSRQPRDVLVYCREHGITVTAYTPLLRGSREQEALVATLAEKYGATREQVLLNWLMAKGMIVIPRSRNLEHIEANWQSLSWTMDAADASQIDALG
jgi:2,5-diketo-D-gluconate reductase B